jgi:hypothetical protein
MGAAAAGAAAAAIAQAVKASGTIVRVEPGEFERILARQPGLLVVTAQGGFFSTKYQYLTSYKGLAFFSESATPLNLPGGAELVVGHHRTSGDWGSPPSVSPERLPKHFVTKMVSCYHPTSGDNPSFRRQRPIDGCGGGAPAFGQ